METEAETGLIAAIRREPEQAALLLKFSLVAALGLVAWDLLAPRALPLIAVKTVMALILLAYGGSIAYFVAKLMSSSDSWASGSKAAVTKPDPRRQAKRDGSNRPVDLETLRRRPDELPPVSEDDQDAETPASAQPPTPGAIDSAMAFSEAYFLMRLQEQVKDARRDGHEMSVAAIHVTLPHQDMTPEIAEQIALQMASLSSGQARVMSPPLALPDCEYLFSLSQASSDEMRRFVREVVRAFGEYWCYFGIATFPKGGTNPDALIENARAACESSLQTGKRGQVEYASA